MAPLPRSGGRRRCGRGGGRRGGAGRGRQGCGRTPRESSSPAPPRVGGGTWGSTSRLCCPEERHVAPPTEPADAAAAAGDRGPDERQRSAEAQRVDCVRIVHWMRSALAHVPEGQQTVL